MPLSVKLIGRLAWKGGLVNCSGVGLGGIQELRRKLLGSGPRQRENARMLDGAMKYRLSAFLGQTLAVCCDIFATLTALEPVYTVALKISLHGFILSAARGWLFSWSTYNSQDGFACSCGTLQSVKGYPGVPLQDIREAIKDSQAKDNPFVETAHDAKKKTSTPVWSKARCCLAGRIVRKEKRISIPRNADYWGLVDCGIHTL